MVETIRKDSFNNNKCLLSFVFFQGASHPEKLYKLGQAVSATVVEASSKPYRFALSLTGENLSPCVVQPVAGLPSVMLSVLSLST